MNEKIIDLEQLLQSSGLDLTEEELLALIVKQHTISTKEIMAMFEISKQRVQGMKNQGLIRELKNGLFNRKEVDLMRAEQVKQRRLSKYNDYELMPAYEVMEGNFIIDKLRFFDCLTMVRVESEEEGYDPTKHVYNIHLTDLLAAIVDAFRHNLKVHMLEHRGFEYVTSEDDLEEVMNTNFYVRSYNKAGFLEMLQSVPSTILGMPKINTYSRIISALAEDQE